MLQAIILGLVQGVTEFLPISSSGHLVLLQELMNVEYGAAFDIILHAGTVLATLIYFWKRLFKLSKEYLWFIAVGSIPAAIVGLLLQSRVEELLSSLPLVIVGFTVTTILLATVPKPKEKKMGYKSAFIVGLAQALAIVPGISRSGSTITTALRRGVNQSQAFTFSFILAIPPIIGATLLNARNAPLSGGDLPMYILGFISSVLSGYFALSLLEKIVEKANLHKFAPYTAFAAVLSAAVFLVQR